MASSHLCPYEQVAPSRLVMSFYCMRMTESDASTSGAASFSRAVPRGSHGTGASIICLYGSQTTLTHVQQCQVGDGWCLRGTEGHMLTPTGWRVRGDSLATDKQ